MTLRSFTFLKHFLKMRFVVSCIQQSAAWQLLWSAASNLYRFFHSKFHSNLKRLSCLSTAILSVPSTQAKYVFSSLYQRRLSTQSCQMPNNSPNSTIGSSHIWQTRLKPSHTKATRHPISLYRLRPFTRLGSGPRCFISYTGDFVDLPKEHAVYSQLYADDTRQFHDSCRPDDTDALPVTLCRRHQWLFLV